MDDDESDSHNTAVDPSHETAPLLAICTIVGRALSSDEPLMRVCKPMLAPSLLYDPHPFGSTLGCCSLLTSRSCCSFLLMFLPNLVLSLLVSMRDETVQETAWTTLRVIAFIGLVNFLVEVSGGLLVGIVMLVIVLDILVMDAQLSSQLGSDVVHFG